MATLKPIKGAPVPLFDRLVDEQPTIAAEPIPRDTHDLDGLIDSVRREIERLLTTRISETLAELKGRDRTVIDYGLPDLGQYYVNSILDLNAVSRHVAKTIASYEPRLLEVAVTVEKQGTGVGGVTAHVSGRVRYENRLESIAFPVHFAVERPMR